MKIKVTKRVEEEIEIETPYYFSNFDHCEVYGVINEAGVFMIQLSSHGDDYSTEITISKNPNAYACYTKSEYKSSAEEFQKALRIAASTVNSISRETV